MFADLLPSSPLPTLSALLKNNDVSLPVQKHLVNVYAALGFAMMCSSLGSWFYMQTHLSPWLTTLGSMVALFSLVTPSQTGRFADRLPNLGLYGFLQGCTIGSLVELALVVQPELVLQASVMTVLVFASFGLVALFSRRRSYLYLGGMLSSAISWLLWSSLFNSWVFKHQGLDEANLFLGLAVFTGYVVFDTQMVIERASLGDFDFCKHAAELFADAVAIFVRILVLLLKSGNRQQQQQQQREQQEGKKRRREN
ncbi:hypothetical protein BASA81_007765 [Batrachochytrium salamandrivorans]|nr:hypothetical protein BASA81_007765 [Batrachochytrium salamandrivorans]